MGKWVDQQHQLVSLSLHDGLPCHPSHCTFKLSQKTLLSFSWLLEHWPPAQHAVLCVLQRPRFIDQSPSVYSLPRAVTEHMAVHKFLYQMIYNNSTHTSLAKSWGKKTHYNLQTHLSCQHLWWKSHLTSSAQEHSDTCVFQSFSGPCIFPSILHWSSSFLLGEIGSVSRATKWLYVWILAPQRLSDGIGQTWSRRVSWGPLVEELGKGYLFYLGLDPGGNEPWHHTRNVSLYIIRCVSSLLLLAPGSIFVGDFLP